MLGKWYVLGLVMLGILPSSSWADNSKNDLVNCIWYDGRPMKEQDCALFRRLKAEEQADTVRQQKINQAAHQRHEKAKAERQEILDKKKAEYDVYAQKRRAEMAHEADELREYREQLAKKEAADEARKERRCGKQYGRVLIGMSYDRVEDCLEGLAYASRTTTASGEIETYYSTFYLINFKDDKVVSFSRRSR